MVEIYSSKQHWYPMLSFLKDRSNDFNANLFVNELVEASMLLGELEAKISNYKFNSILMPMLHSKEAIASMYIEGTQTTITNVLEDNIATKPSQAKEFVEFRNHIHTLRYGEDYMRADIFSHSFIQKIHEFMLKDICDSSKIAIGHYKEKIIILSIRLEKSSLNHHPT